MNIPSKKDIVIIVVTNVDDDDFSIIFDNLEYPQNVLVVCDENSIKGYTHPIERIISSFTDPKSIIQDLEKQKQDRNFVGIIGFDEEYHYRFSYEIAKHFSLEYYKKEVLDIASNKYLQRTSFKKGGIKSPRFTTVTLNNPKHNLPYPNVLKVITGYASSFVYLNKDEKHYLKNIETLKKEQNDPDNLIFKSHTATFSEKESIFDPRQTYIVEEYIEGDEYSCDYMISKGSVKVLRVVRKLKFAEHFGVFKGFYLFNPEMVPSCPFTLNELTILCEKIANTIKIRSGVCMIDFIFNKGIYIIETTVRPGISTFIELMAKIYGTTSIDLLHKEKLGILQEYHIPSETGLVAYMTMRKSGKIMKFKNSFESKEKVLNIVKYYEVGKEMEVVEESMKLLGYVLIKEVDEKEIETIMDKMKDEVVTAPTKKINDK